MKIAFLLIKSLFKGQSRACVFDIAIELTSVVG